MTAPIVCDVEETKCTTDSEAGVVLLELREMGGPTIVARLHPTHAHQLSSELVRCSAHLRRRGDDVG